LDDDERALSKIETNAGLRELVIVSESGLFQLILRSNKPAAKSYRRWVTKEVLPALHRTGRYEVQPKTDVQVIAEGLLAAQRLLEAERAERRRAELQTAAAVHALEETKPKAEAFDQFLSIDGDMSLNEAAKALSRGPLLKIGEDRLRGWMLLHDWIYRDAAGAPRAYQARVDIGHLAERTRWHTHPRTGGKVLDPPQVRVTPRGLDLLARRLAPPGVAA
jgi:prophage antirepressor-like protein